MPGRPRKAFKTILGTIFDAWRSRGAASGEMAGTVFFKRQALSETSLRASQGAQGGEGRMASLEFPGTPCPPSSGPPGLPPASLGSL